MTMQSYEDKQFSIPEADLQMCRLLAKKLPSLIIIYEVLTQIFLLSVLGFEIIEKMLGPCTRIRISNF